VEKHMEQSLNRNFFQRLLGLPATSKPLNEDCWKFSDSKLEIDLNSAKELGNAGGAIRIESKELPAKILVFHGTDDKYYAFNNKCTHMGRRIDPVPGTKTIQCCSIGKTLYDYDGKAKAGLGKGKLRQYPVEKSLDKLVIHLSN